MAVKPIVKSTIYDLAFVTEPLTVGDITQVTLRVLDAPASSDATKLLDVDLASGSARLTLDAGGSTFRMTQANTAALEAGINYYYVECTTADGVFQTDHGQFEVQPNSDEAALQTIENGSFATLLGEQSIDDLGDVVAGTIADGVILVGDGTNFVEESGATARESLGARGPIGSNEVSGLSYTILSTDVDKVVSVSDGGNPTDTVTITLGGVEEGEGFWLAVTTHPITVNPDTGLASINKLAGGVSVNIPAAFDSGTGDWIGPSLVRVIRTSSSEWYVAFADQPLLATNDLSDVSSAATARQNLEVGRFTSEQIAGTTYTVDGDDLNKLLLFSGTSPTVTLSSGLNTGFSVLIVNGSAIGSGVTIETAGSELINGSASLVLPEQFDKALLVFYAGLFWVAVVSTDGIITGTSLSTQSITGATTQDQVDSVVSALVALGLATDDR